MTKIILPTEPIKRDYVLYLFKNRNDFHSMNDKDINNLVKIINRGYLDVTDYPVLKENKDKICKMDGHCFSKSSNEYYSL